MSTTPPPVAIRMMPVFLVVLMWGCIVVGLTVHDPVNKAVLTATRAKPVVAPIPELPGGGTRLSPGRFFVAYYGLPGAPALGILGSGSPGQVWPRLMREARAFKPPGLTVQPVFEVIATVASSGPGRHGDFTSDIPNAVVRRYIDAATATLNWEATNAQGGSAGSGSSTLASFTSAHPGLKLQDVSIVGGSCNLAEAFYIDGLTLTAGAIDATTDFEAPLPSTLANFGRPTSVPTGTVVTLGARLTHSSAPAPGETVSLYAHAVGGSYRLVKSLTTSSTGAVSMKVAPNSTTTYQWRYSGANTKYAPVNGSAFTIVSRQRVAVTSKPTSAAYGTNAVLKGRITPHKGGVTVRLVRLVNGQRIVVANAKTVYGGYFSIKAPMKVRGTSTYLVSALPYPDEDLGQSATFKITTK